MAKISKIYAREILDSRGFPTIQTMVILDDNNYGIASVPSGISMGKHEAVELRDGDPTRFHGMGVLKAVENVNGVIAVKLVGMDPENQKGIDTTLIELDGTENKRRLGANAILSVSQSVCEAAAATTGQTHYQYVASLYGGQTGLKVPTPTFNLINGGKHGAGNLDFQEFHLIPASTKSYHQALQMGEEVYHTLEGTLARRGAIHSVGHEGGFAPDLFTNVEALEVMMEAISEANYIFGEDCFLGLDVAASHFYEKEKYLIKDKPQPLSGEEFIAYYKELIDKYHLFLLEDPFYEDDWETWTALHTDIGENTIVIGDDLLVTNKKRLERAIESKACSAILVKPNQAGTISETLEVIKTAKAAGFKVIVSHRSGETNDPFIADFAVGVGADFTKFGAPARGERVAKYNRLLAIEAEFSTRKQVQVDEEKPS